MRGHIRKRGKKWCVIVYLGRDEKGKPKQKWYSGFDSKKEAESAMVGIIHDINHGTYVEPVKITLRAFLLNWVESYARVNVSAKTCDRYEEIIKRHLVPALGHIPIQKLHPIHIQNYYAEKLKDGKIRGEGGLAPRSVLHHHRVLRAALQQAVKWMLIVRNPADAVDPPRPGYSEMKTLNAKETVKLLQVAMKSRVYVPVLLAVTTGMRRGEIVALQWKDVDLEKETITVRRTLERIKGGYQFKHPKTRKSRRQISLTPSAAEELRRHKHKQKEEKLRLGAAYNDHGLVCAWPDGTLVKPDFVSREFTKILKKAGLPIVRFHDLRHSHATLLMIQGVHPKIVSERLGHSTVRITLDVYSHVVPGLQKEAAHQFDAALQDAGTKNDGRGKRR